MEEKMKMTKQEVKEEFKEMEGDPYIKKSKSGRFNKKWHVDE